MDDNAVSQPLSERSPEYRGCQARTVTLGRNRFPDNDHLSAVGAFHPGPRTTRPGFCPVCSPSFNTPTPFTHTSWTPVAYWCGCSYVAWSAMVLGSKTTMSAK